MKFLLIFIVLPEIRNFCQTAERFNHINVIYPIANGEDVLFGRHANDTNT